jgi:serine/threonine protein kinase
MAASGLASSRRVLGANDRINFAVIGCGGMGTVYRARDRQLERTVAIKIVKRSLSSHGLLARFLHERQILAGLDHGNIAKLLDGGTTTLGTAQVTSHSVNLSGLAAGTTYHFRVKSRDAAGNLSVSNDFTFTSAAAPDTTAPTISGVGTSNVTSSGAIVGWATDELADTQVERLLQRDPQIIQALISEPINFLRLKGRMQHHIGQDS